MTSQPDYIIIGGGTSGLVVANRLSEDPAVQVLILEAGDDLTADPRVNVPAFWTTLMGSEADWQFQSVPQAGLGGRSIKEPQGKTLGGSSAINGQAWIAPGRAGIDAWAELGNPGWDWASLLPFYKKAYTLRPPTDPETLEHLGIDWIDEEFRGTDGPIQVSFPGVKENPLCKAWIDAFRGLDKITSGDPFSGKSIGGYSNTAAVDPDAKVRSFAGSAYGLPALQRPNVKLVTKAQVQSIRFSKDADGSVIATEVQASVDGGDVTTFTPAKEVILAAGAYNTPKLLELSGIGSKTILDKHGIPVVLDLPGVGENLQDHLMTGVSYEVTEGVFTGDPLMRQEPEALAFAQKLYTEHKAGPFTVGGTQSHAFMPTPDANDSKFLRNSTSNEKDTELQEVIRSIVEKEDEASAAWFMFLAQANLHEGAKSFVGTKLMPENFASFGCSQTHPFSRGSTHIASTKPEDMPEIDPRYFSHPADLEIMARHVQAIDRLHNVKELAPFIKVDGKRNHPDAYKLQDLEGAKRYVLDTATTTYHSCGTAVMLPQEKGGVVDTELRVYGTKNLRIIDASIIPLVPRGNIMTSVYAVAEKAAHIIKGQ